ncbi:MSHA biogenesis protein mshI [Vibrio ishigakensis]|uniref:MSHA biogenesis protein mshI n=1 Tax=Vibrio ishigakensis TaxID=1481914 RepID=A0A0B8QK39_9VIBR|nr:MSHA biogenesis protein mshI [Vibrio ishigakensis]
MSWFSKINNLFSSSNEDYQLIIIIQADAVYVSRKPQGDKAPQSIAISHGNWENAFQEALAMGGKKEKVCVVLGAAHYQSYQIDKPSIPESEWPAALPFLLKDLVTDPVADIVADARVMPDGQKVLAYAIKKRLAQALAQNCEQQGLELIKILPEDEVWGQSFEEQENFFLLRRSEQDFYHLSAYVSGSPVFSRTLRGLNSPVTAESAAPGVIDSLALDIQRSADYLSANLSGVLFRNLVISCDGDKAQTLTEQLQSIVSLSVVTLSEPPLPCAVVLVNTANGHELSNINLYPSHLKPQKEAVSLNKVITVWALTAVVFGVLAYLENAKTQEYKQTLVSLKSQSSLLTQEKATLQQRLSNHTPTQSKLDAAKRIEEDIAAKRSSLEAVGKFDDSQKVGFSGIMDALATQARNDISLQHIQITSDSLNLVGVASTPQAIPSWLNQFKEELVLVGRTFESLNIGRDDRNVVTFELKAKSGGKR